MTTFICGGPASGFDGLPPVDPNGMCCEAAVYSDGESCSCWTEIYSDPAPADLHAGPANARRTLCEDCAYRPGSPERAEQGGAQLDASLARPFTCHQGMSRLLGYTVPAWCEGGSWKTGAFSVPARLVHDRDNFQPAIRGGRAWGADGQPSDLCGGWAAVTGVRRPEPAGRT